MKNKVLVTGGAGYIGSHTILELLEANEYEVISLDNYCNSSVSSLEELEKYTGNSIHKLEIDLTDYLAVKDALTQFKDQIVGVIHFAALKAVGDSVEQPVNYYSNNLLSLLNMLKLCEEFYIENFIFSSSCSVFGNINADSLPVTESTSGSVTQCPYAETKSMGERILKDVSFNKTIKALSLRYFNPVGSHESNVIGENPKTKPNNLVPIICKSALGEIAPMGVFGDDYKTRDGSCIRDYIHVVDIAKAHVKALDYIVESKDNYDVINLGSGNGVSVFEAIQAFEKVTGQELKYNVLPRRAGDVEAVYSDSTKAEKLLGWKAVLGIEDMMHSAWNWENKLAQNK